MKGEVRSERYVLPSAQPFVGLISEEATRDQALQQRSGVNLSNEVKGKCSLVIFVSAYSSSCTSSFFLQNHTLV